MAIMLITGVIGAGKTLRAVQEIQSVIDSGRFVYTNIDGLNLPGVFPLPENDDWRLLPDGSYVAYDEAHQIFPSSGKPGLSADQRVNHLDESRHRGMDFIFITQFPTKLHHEVRQYVDRHLHVYRLSGAQAATIYEWPHTVINPNDRDERRLSDSAPWRYPKNLYGVYTSSVEHTSSYKLRVPKKIYLYLGMILVPLSLTLYLISTSAFFNRDNAPGVVAQPVVYTQSGYTLEQIQQSSDVMVYGCVASARDCMCYDSEGMVINQTPLQCRDMIERPIRYPIFEQRKSSKG